MSITRADSAKIVGIVIHNTLAGACGGGLIVLVFQKLKSGFKSQGKWNHSLTLNGALIGIVAQCAGCNTYYCWSSLLIGCFAGMTYIGISNLILRLKIDDPLDAIAVHAGAGKFMGT